MKINSLTIYKFCSLILLGGLISFVSCGQSKTTDGSPDKRDKNTQAVVEVYDFHSTSRCQTCVAIENNARQTIETYFASPLKEGRIAFKVINVDDPGNEAIAKEFKAFGTS